MSNKSIAREIYVAIGGKTKSQGSVGVIKRVLDKHTNATTAERDRLRNALGAIAETLERLPDSEQPFFVIGAALTELAEKANAEIAAAKKAT